ncbi:hypothetical protein D3C77_28820 [compost metagenome]|jgi:MFS family permease
MILETWGWPLTIAILSAGVRCAVDGKYASLYGVVQAILLGLLFGSITNLYLLDYIDDKGELLSHTKRAAYVGVSSAFSQELFLWLKGVMANPLEIFKRGKNGS